MEDLQREMKAMAAEMGELRREVEQLRSSDNTGDVTINPLSDDEDRVSAGEREGELETTGRGYPFQGPRASGGTTYPMMNPRVRRRVDA